MRSSPDNLERGRLTPKRQRIVDRARRGLPALLRSPVLDAAERVAAGLHLAVIGDPRPQAVEVDAMKFCWMPAGRFFLGASDADAFDDEKKGAGDHKLDYAYWLARFPVTVAQFRRFVQESGFEPENGDCLRGPANTPLVYVSWKEAQTFCGWLSARWREKGWLPKGRGAGLPSEPEWEKAAKGGYEIPTAALIRPVSAIGGHPVAPPTWTTNPEPRRPYPWIGGVDAERMNFAMTIGRVSPVGAYAGGRSPYGCEELSGNLWEWTRSRNEPYPYPEDAAGRSAREDRQAVPRVLGGGSVIRAQGLARCSSRYDDFPHLRFKRVVFVWCCPHYSEI